MLYTLALLLGMTASAQVSVGGVMEALTFNNHLSDNVNDLNGYGFVEWDLVKGNFKIGPEMRYYISATMDGRRLYEGAGGLVAGYDGKSVGFKAGYLEPFKIEDNGYFNGIFSGELNFKFKDSKSFEPFINFNYYTNAKLFAYTYSVGAGFKIKL